MPNGARAARAATSLAIVCLVTACSGSLMLDTGDVQDSVSTGLTEQAGGSFTVTCPAEAPAQAGYTFTCSVADATDGSTRTVTVVEVDDAGAFTWKVTGGGPSPAASPSGTPSAPASGSASASAS